MDVVKGEKFSTDSRAISKTFNTVLLLSVSMKVNEKTKRTKEEATSGIVTSMVIENMKKYEKS